MSQEPVPHPELSPPCYPLLTYYPSLPPTALFQQVLYLKYTHTPCLWHPRTYNRCPQQHALKTRCQWAATFFHYLKHFNGGGKRMESHYYMSGWKDTIPGTGPRPRILRGCGQSISVSLRAEECSLAVYRFACFQIQVSAVVARVGMQVSATGDAESHWTWQGLAIHG